MAGLNGLRRWVAVDAVGNALGAGWTLGRFDQQEIVFTSDRQARRWQRDGCRYVRLYKGNLARMLQKGSIHQHIDEYDHGPVKRCRRAAKMALQVKELSG